MKVFQHHIYEYKKGLRSLVLLTVNSSLLEDVLYRLESNNISYYLQMVTSKKVNVFFGNSDCIEVVKHFNIRRLSDLTPEQDFILGIMLGYGRLQQCGRYLERSKILNYNLPGM